MIRHIARKVWNVDFVKMLLLRIGPAIIAMIALFLDYRIEFADI